MKGEMKNDCNSDYATKLFNLRWGGFTNNNVNSRIRACPESSFLSV